MNSPDIFSMFIDSIHRSNLDSLSGRHWIRYRSEYDYILSQICLANRKGSALTMGALLEHSTLGSQPTVTKRVQELEKLQFIQSKTMDDARVRSFTLTAIGEDYLKRCSQIICDCFEECGALSVTSLSRTP